MIADFNLKVSKSNKNKQIKYHNNDLKKSFNSGHSFILFLFSKTNINYRRIIALLYLAFSFPVSGCISSITYGSKSWFTATNVKIALLNISLSYLTLVCTYTSAATSIDVLNALVTFASI